MCLCVFLFIYFFRRGGVEGGGYLCAVQEKKKSECSVFVKVAACVCRSGLVHFLLIYL